MRRCTLASGRGLVLKMIPALDRVSGVDAKREICRVSYFEDGHVQSGG
jgi:hypothetical protein